MSFGWFVDLEDYEFLQHLRDEAKQLQNSGCYGASVQAQFVTQYQAIEQAATRLMELLQDADPTLDPS